MDAFIHLQRSGWESLPQTSVLSLHCVYGSLGNVVKILILIQEGSLGNLRVCVSVGLPINGNGVDP